MAGKSPSLKKQIKNKLLNFQKTGLESYAKYLELQLKQNSKGSHKKAYTAYIEKQIEQTAGKLKKIDGNLKKLG